ncbi:hypothetical protein FQN55_006952 [Onygenales sp. PD_40]|nr:hypothetical protein FQN55_006952 [Onygenales sp. PD_40]KAK2776343.1 hypothetical protein FQN52_003486 [Onygenales sp. PD_12]KAK2791360.1 hypothetical protein FQN53_004541 [Emmonsiellopsis sp. PD_33]
MAASSVQGEIRTRFCLISDTHAFVPSPPSHWSPFRLPFPSADVLLHAGDLTMVGKDYEHQKTVDMLKSADAEVKIVIAGNHDITLDEKYYNEYGYRRHGIREDLAKIRDLYCGEDARRHGIVYLEEGLKTFKLKSGAQFTVYSSPYQPEFCQWAFPYERDEDRYNPPTAENPIPSFPAVDIMLTHGPPKGIMDETYNGEPVGCDHLRCAVARARPRLHCFGHIHEGYGATRMEWGSDLATKIELDQAAVFRNRSSYIDVSHDSASPLKTGEETLFINASIVTVNYDPVNAPWLVDIDLPRSTGE